MLARSAQRLSALSSSSTRASPAAFGVRSFSALQSSKTGGSRIATSISASSQLPTARRSFTTSASRMSPPVGDPKDATRPPPDKVFDDIADYVHNFKIDSDLAMNTARLCLMDTIGCVGSDLGI